MTDFNDPNATAARRLRLLDALHLNPDKRAEDRNIGMATGTPIGLVDDNTRQQYRVDQMDAQMQGLSVLPAAVRKSETFATLAQDDLETLASLEKVTKARQRRANAMAAAIRKANEPGLLREFGSSVWTGLRRFANNIDLQQADAARQRINDIENREAADIVWGSLRDPDFDVNTYLDEQNDAIAAEEDNIRRNVGEYEEDLPALQPVRSEQTAREMQEYSAQQNLWDAIAYMTTHPRVAVNMTGDSLGAMAPALAATIASGGALGAPAAMGTMGVGTLQTEYSTTLAERIDAAVQQQNKSRTDILADRKLMEEIRHAASVRGSVIGATEAATLGVSGILYRSIRNKIAATAAGMASEVVGGAGGEAAAQLAVDGRITSWSDVAAEGLLEIVLGAPEVAMHATFARNQLQAEHNADLENQDATAEAVRNSRTRARAPDVFDQYVRDLVEDSDVGDIYADGNALHQDGLDEALAEALPERADDIRAAVENGGAVQIPLEDYLSRIAPNEELTNALRPHIRDADGMSAHELENHALGELEQDIRNEITRLTAEDTRAAEIQALEQSIIEQLNTAGQTTTEANRTYATLYAASVDTLSRRMGISPQEYHAQYGIHIVGGQVAIRTQAGEQTLTPAEAARRLAAGEEKALIDSLRKQTGELGTTDFDARIDALEAQYNSTEADALPQEIHAYARANGYTARRTGNGIGQFEWVKENAQDGAGVLYQFAGTQALTADHAALAQAQERIAAGENAESVRQETGWHQGTDGQWRFEIADDRAKIRKNGVRKKNPTFADVYSKTRFERGSNFLEEFLEHKALYAAYPRLRRAFVALETDPKAAGSYEAATNTIRLNGGQSLDETLATLLHEIQHAIQEQENFARGGHFAELGYGDYRRLAGEVEARNTEARREMDAQARRETAPQATQDVATAEQIIGEDTAVAAKLDETADSAFAQAIERVVSGENITGFVPMGTTPEALQLAGLPDVRVSIRGNVIKKVMSEWLGDGHGHNLNPDTLKRLPMELNRPVAVARSAQDSSNRDAYIVLTELTETDIYDGKEKPVIAALMVNVTNGGLEVVNITSVYGRSKAQIQRSLNTDLLYWDKEKGKQFVNAFRLQLPSHLRTEAALAKANIKTNEDLTQGANPQQEFAATAKQYGGEAAYEQAKVAGETELDYRQWVQVRTPSFKAWFGDWENDPKNASKVVNPRTGEPQVVYHGTNAQFDTFDTPLNMPRIFLTRSRAFAQKYGRDSMPLFVNARNTLNVDYAGRGAFDEIEVNGESLYDIEELADHAWENGYDGVLADNVVDSGTRDAKQSINDEVIVTDPAQIKSATGNTGAFDPADANIYHQNTPTPRGYFSPDSNTITLTPNADLSTFIHELGHYFLETLTRHATELRARHDAGEALTDGQKQIIKDADTILANLGGLDLDTWHSMTVEEKRSHHELAARQFETYILEGKAPSLELQGAFQRFRAWLFRIYKAARNLNAPLNDEVRQIFDRLLASDEAIELAEQNRSMMQLFATPEEAGMTPEQFAEYQQQGRDATQAAQDEMQARALRDTKYIRNLRNKALRRKQQEAKAARQQAEMQARQMVLNLPVYRVWQFLSATTKENGGQEPLRLDREALLNLGYSEAQIKQLGRKVRKTGGVHPDLVAELFQDEDGNALYDSGDALVQALLAAKRPQDAINDVADDIMLQQFGELATPQAVAFAADMAVHNDIRLRLIASEANVLAKAVGNKTLLNRAARQLAQETIAAKRLRDIHPAQYTRMEARAAKAAALAQKKGDIATAAAEKRNQLLQAHLARAAYEAQEEAGTHLRYLKRMSRLNPKNIDIKQREQIEAILERYNLREQSGRAIDRKQSLAEWVQAQREQGIEPDIAPEMLDELKRQPWQTLTVDELRGLVDTVRQIEHRGKMENQLLLEQKQQDLNVAKEEIGETVKASGNGKIVDNSTPATWLGQRMAALRRFGWMHTKASTVFYILDGGQRNGPMWRYFGKLANARANFEAAERARLSEALMKISAPLFKRKGLYKRSIRSDIPDRNGQPRVFTPMQVFTVALNMGNAGNLQRLLDGNHWTREQVERLTANLTGDEWRAVQDIWNLFESMKEQVAAKERRVNGIEPQWVEAVPLTVTSIDGETLHLRGGYYPVKYDAGQSQQAEQFQDAEAGQVITNAAFTSATTRRSYTKARAAAVKDRPLLLDISVMYDGLNEIVHDLAWHEFLIDANRLIRSHRVDSAIRDYHGAEYVRLIKDWLQDIAAGDKIPSTYGARMVAAIRQNVSFAGLAFNVVSALKQLSGLPNSIVRVGAPDILAATLQYMRRGRAMTREAVAASAVMENRARTRFRELNEVRNSLRRQGRVKQQLYRWGYAPLLFFQQQVDVITWHGEYHKQLAAGMNEADAVALADQAVLDAQGGGELKDLSAIERDPVGKIFTVFYSYMNTVLNLGIVTVKGRASIGRKAAALLTLFTVPAIIDTLLGTMLTLGDDDDDETLGQKLVEGQIGYLMGLTVLTREASGAAKALFGVDKGSYKGPTAFRFFDDLHKAAKQIGQGEMDEAMLTSIINLSGDFGLPSAQINRSIKGIKALQEDKTDNPLAVLTGYQEKK